MNTEKNIINMKDNIISIEVETINVKGGSSRFLFLTHNIKELFDKKSGEVKPANELLLSAKSHETSIEVVAMENYDKEGKLHGKQLEIDDNGETIAEGFYIKDKENGVWFDREEELPFKIYKNGEIIEEAKTKEELDEKICASYGIEMQ